MEKQTEMRINGLQLRLLSLESKFFITVGKEYGREGPWWRPRLCLSSLEGEDGGCQVLCQAPLGIGGVTCCYPSQQIGAGDPGASPLRAGL